MANRLVFAALVLALGLAACWSAQAAPESQWSDDWHSALDFDSNFCVSRNRLMPATPHPDTDDEEAKDKETDESDYFQRGQFVGQRIEARAGACPDQFRQFAQLTRRKPNADNPDRESAHIARSTPFDHLPTGGTWQHLLDESGNICVEQNLDVASWEDMPWSSILHSTDEDGSEMPSNYLSGRCPEDFVVYLIMVLRGGDLRSMRQLFPRARHLLPQEEIACDQYCEKTACKIATWQELVQILEQPSSVTLSDPDDTSDMDILQVGDELKGQVLEDSREICTSGCSEGCEATGADQCPEQCRDFCIAALTLHQHVQLCVNGCEKGCQRARQDTTPTS